MSDDTVTQPESTTPAPERINLLGLDRAGLIELFDRWGEKPYRATQVMKWLYKQRELDIDAMTDISRKLRDRMLRETTTALPEIAVRKVSKDGTRKWAMQLPDGNRVETVLIPDKGRNTVCVSSQVGCMLDCTFCSTGKQGFAGNLSAADIVGQIWHVHNELLSEGDGERGVTNVVFMGMGEPLLNFDPVLTSSNIFMDDLAFMLSKRRVTVSTAGVVPGIYKLAEHTDVALAISLHAPTDALREKLVPLNKKYDIRELMKACRHYLSVLGEKRSITIEYTLMDGVNDELEHARQLCTLLRPLRCKVNLIPFNPFPGAPFKRPDMARVRTFQTYLMNQGFATMLRTTRGDDIDAACGQLVGQVADRTRRAERYRDRIQATQI